MGPNLRFKHTNATTERVRVEFIKRELRTGMNYARLAHAEAEMGMPEDAKRAEENARRVYAAFTGFLPMIEQHLSEEDGIEIEQMRVQLEQLLMTLPPTDPSEQPIDREGARPPDHNHGGDSKHQ